MTISIKQARKFLGEENVKYTDTQILELVSYFTKYADLIIDCYIANKKGE